jgi:shikimate dehydrogenase
MQQQFTGRIVLIGFMGSGKSTVARGLADDLQLTLYDVDTEIVARSGHPSIPAIFAQAGEPHFRQLETEVCAALRDTTAAVISTGGGSPINPENLRHLTNATPGTSTVVVLLRTSFDQILKRAADLQDRPLFADIAAARALFEQRAPVYQQAADIIVDTDGKSSAQVCTEIRTALVVRHTIPARLRVSAHAEKTLIIGAPVRHSLSPTMHNGAYAALRLPFVMAAAEVQPEHLPAAIQGVRALGVRGLAVTMPHKVEIIPLLDRLDQTAAAIGAVNTVVQRNGELIGYNTDWLGILNPLSQRCTLSGLRVALLGAGGAALAALYACTSAGATVTIFNRSYAKAATLAARWGCSARPLETLEEVRGYDIIINTTAVGMGELAHSSPVPAQLLHSGQIIFETIYAPRTTQLVRAAQERGATTITGIEMFIEQGRAQFELHTGVLPAREILDGAVGGGRD